MAKLNQKTGEIIPMVYSWRHPREVKALKCDEKLIQHYGFAYNPDNRALEVVETELEDREAYIQSFADDCGVYNVLKKYAKTGDASLLSQREGFYGDISDIPEDNLDPVAAQKAAALALEQLNAKLGTDLSQDDISKLSVDELVSLINKAVESSQPKQQEEGNKEGE